MNPIAAVYGKTMENVRDIIDVRLVSNEKDCLKWASKPSYISQKILDNNLVAICKNKATLTRSKPACVKMWMFDLSRVLMYKFHYDYIKNKYGNNFRLLFTATDSLMYEIKTEDAFEDFNKDKKMFDFGSYVPYMMIQLN